MPLGDLARDAQAAARAEARHQLGQLGGADALAAVLHREAHQPRARAPAAHLHLAAARRGADGVGDQVVEQAAQELLVAPQLDGPRRQIRDHRHRSLASLRLRMLGGGLEQLAQIERPRVDRGPIAPARRLQNPLCQLHGPQGLPRRRRRAVALPRRERGVARQKLGIADHRLQRAAHVVRGVGQATLQRGDALVEPLAAGEEIDALDDRPQPAEENLRLVGHHHFVRPRSEARRARLAHRHQSSSARAEGSDILYPQHHHHFGARSAVVRRGGNAAAGEPRAEPSHADRRAGDAQTWGMATGQIQPPKPIDFNPSLRPA